MIETFEGHTPQFPDDSLVHEAATLIGKVSIGHRSSIWPGVILRGDMGRIVIGDETSIQDGSVVHLTEGLSETVVGDRVTVGHKVLLHGCVVEDECLIGMGAILLDNVKVGKGSVIGAGALLTYGTEIPPGSLVLGAPGKVVREVRDKDREMIAVGWKTYVDYTARYLAQRA